MHVINMHLVGADLVGAGDIQHEYQLPQQAIWSLPST